MTSRPTPVLTARVERAAAIVLARDGRLTYPALFVEMGILDPRDLAAWRSGRAPYLERVLRSNLTRLVRIQKAVRRIARDQQLQRRPSHPPPALRYSKTGNAFVEAEYACVYLVSDRRG